MNNINDNDIINNTKFNKDTKKSNYLCILSVLFLFVPLLTYTPLFVGISEYLKEIDNVALSLFFFCIQAILLAFPLISFVLIVYVIADYPKNKIGKFLFFLYIACIIFFLIKLLIAIIKSHALIKLLLFVLVL